MDNRRNYKILTIIILVIGVLGISIGFALFSSELLIKSKANVNPNASAFKVGFSTTSGSLVQGEVEPAITYTSSIYNDKMVNASNALIDNSTDVSTIRNLSAVFTSPGQSVTYTFYAYNEGEYKAYLNSIKFNNATGESSPKVCIPKNGTSSSEAAQACNNITLSIKVGNDTYTSSNQDINLHTLNSKASEEVVVTISYAGEEELSNGDFTVKYGDISLTYSSID